MHSHILHLSASIPPRQFRSTRLLALATMDRDRTCDWREVCSIPCAQIVGSSALCLRSRALECSLTSFIESHLRLPVCLGPRKPRQFESRLVTAYRPVASRSSREAAEGGQGSDRHVCVTTVPPGISSVPLSAGLTQLHRSTRLSWCAHRRNPVRARTAGRRGDGPRCRPGWPEEGRMHNWTAIQTRQRTLTQTCVRAMMQHRRHRS